MLFLAFLNKEDNKNFEDDIFSFKLPSLFLHTEASMKKVTLMSAITAAVSLSIAVAHAEINGEKCTPMKDGKNIVKANKNDCQTASHSCAGQSKAGDADAWIYVPKGQCAKINSGDLTNISADIKDKLEGV